MLLAGCTSLRSRALVWRSAALMWFMLVLHSVYFCAFHYNTHRRKAVGFHSKQAGGHLFPFVNQLSSIFRLLIKYAPACLE